MAVNCGITVIKTFDYRGAPEEWSNHYLLSGATPADDAAWHTLAADLAAIEKTLYRPSTHIVRFLGYADADPTHASVYSHTESTPIAGTLAHAADNSLLPGDAAGTLRWDTGRRSSTGKPVYLRKYIHGAERDDSSVDLMSDEWRAAAATFVSSMQSGFGTGSRHIVDKFGTAVVGGSVSPWVTTRTLKRRGKRPT